MNCILIWSIVNLFLYKCPNVAVLPLDKNCTTVHEGTYDQEFMLMCSEPIETPATTTQSSMENETSTTTASPPQVHTSTLPSYSPPPATTTQQTHSTTAESLDPNASTTPSSTTEMMTTSTHMLQTTTSQPKNPSTTTFAFIIENNSYIPPNESKVLQTPILQQTIIHHETDNTVIIVALCISSVSLIGCVLFAVWSCKKHAEHKKHKIVRPSGVNVELSPTATTPLRGADDVENQLKTNKQKMNILHAKTARPFERKVSQVSGSQTTRAPTMMNKRPSQVKKMSLQDWKQLQSELKKKPIVNRKTKPPKKQFKGPPAPVVSQQQLKIPPLNMKNVSTVKTMIDKFNKK